MVYKSLGNSHMNLGTPFQDSTSQQNSGCVSYEYASKPGLHEYDHTLLNTFVCSPWILFAALIFEPLHRYAPSRNRRPAPRTPDIYCGLSPEPVGVQTL